MNRRRLIHTMAKDFSKNMSVMTAMRKHITTVQGYIP